MQLVVWESQLVLSVERLQLRALKCLEGSWRESVGVSLEMCSFVSLAGTMMGVVPSASAISWLPTFEATSATGAVGGIGGMALTAVTAPVVSTTPPPALLTSASLGMEVPTGTYVGEGVLPVPERLAKKILNLGFVEMRELMPETWLMEEEERSRPTWCLPRRKNAPVTDILQWLQCFAAMVGVLSQRYPVFVPELMAYQTTIIKCSKDFDGIAWAQYDRAYRRQAAQSKDLRWSRLNTTLYSLCFAGKAKRGVACAHCLSNAHASEGCPDNPAKAYLPVWYTSGPSTTSTGSAPQYGQHLKVCHLFNAKGGSRCTYTNCKFAHVCATCRGGHPRSAPPKGRSTTEYPGPSMDGRKGMGFKRPRQE